MKEGNKCGACDNLEITPICEFCTAQPARELPAQPKIEAPVDDQEGQA